MEVRLSRGDEGLVLVGGFVVWSGYLIFLCWCC